MAPRSDSIVDGRPFGSKPAERFDASVSIRTARSRLSLGGHAASNIRLGPIPNRREHDAPNESVSCMKLSAPRTRFAPDGVPWTIHSCPSARSWSSGRKFSAIRADRDGKKTLIFGRGNNPINFVVVAERHRPVHRELAAVDPEMRGVAVYAGGRRESVVDGVRRKNDNQT